MIEIFIDYNNGFTTKIANATFSEFEVIKKKIKNPLISVICLADTIIIKKYIIRVYYKKKEEQWTNIV